MAPSAGGKVKLGLASLLSGYSLEELGFNPVSIPAWLQTNLEASTLRDQIPNGTVMIDLGTIIDGVSDIGFRNMLTGAKREFGVKLPQNEVFHALTNSQDTPPPAAAAPALPATVPPMTIQPAAPPQNAFVPPQEAPPAAMFTPAPAPATAMDAPTFVPSPPVVPAFAVTPVTAPPAPPAPIAFSP
ncbi:MAG: hypothetical protein JNG86_18445, partial [Verrucomicrobiaceae bacterium]|nr:hypothetical protein [Verrucomicrobiaceae bacterium]